MIDIHSHIIPFVDDGCRTMEEAIKIAREYVLQGVELVICTPHFEWIPKRMLILDVNEKFQLLKDTLKQLNINLNLLLGREIYFSNEIVNIAKKHQLITLNNTEYILLELYNVDIDANIEEIVYELGLYGYKVIIAHLERYHSLDINLVNEIRKTGALIQINASSVLNEKINTKIFKLIKEDCIDFIASDVHSFRENDLKKAYEVIKKKYSNKVDDLFYNNQKKYLIH
jgi:protein-tyrosine phosphatase